MPVFRDNSDRAPLPTVASNGIPNRIIEQALAEGTDVQPSLVKLPSTVQSDFFAPVPLPPTAGIPAQSQTANVRAQVIAGIEPFTESINSESAAPETGVIQQQRAQTAATTGVETSPQANSSGTIFQFAESIARIESGGRYDAVGPNTRYGTAKGKYQFVDETWRRAAALVSGANRYGSATAAPDSVQDQVAQAWFRSLLERYNGNYEAVAIAHHAGEGTADRFIRTGQVNTSDVLGTQTSDYARNALRGAFG